MAPLRWWAGWGWVCLPISNRLCNWEARPILSLGHEFIPLPVYSIGGTHHAQDMQYWLCSGGDQLCSFTILFKHCWDAELLGVVVNPSGQMGLRDTLHSGWSCEGLGWEREESFWATLNSPDRLFTTNNLR